MTEAAWLLREHPHALRQLFKHVDENLFRVLALDEGAAAWIGRFMATYDDLPAQVADAALMYLAEQQGIETFFTLDRRDFSVYRLSGGRTAKLLPPS